MREFDLDCMSLEEREEFIAETNASRISYREEIIGPSLDANQIEDFSNLREEQVMERNGKVLGFKSELPRRKVTWD